MAHAKGILNSRFVN